MSAAVLWITVTLCAYGIAAFLYRRSGHSTLLLPVLVGPILVGAVLQLGGSDYSVYACATAVLTELAGPATVALAVPLYRQARMLGALAVPLSAALLAGCGTSLAATAIIALWLDVPLDLVLSIAPKSATMPLAMAAAESVGGAASIAALGVVSTGLLGAMMVGPLARFIHHGNDTTYGFTAGLVAHAIGVSSVMQTRPGAVAFAAVAMGANGLTTALAMPVLAGLVV
jgi:putative effector of murein hydrolase